MKTISIAFALALGSLVAAGTILRTNTSSTRDDQPLLEDHPNAALVSTPGAGETYDQKINEAIDSLGEGMGDGTGVVYLGAGEYILEGPIYLHSGVRLVGVGSHAAGTQLTVGEIGEANAAIQIVGTEVDPVERCSVENLTIAPEGGTDTRDWLGGILLENARHCHFENVRIHDFGTMPLIGGQVPPGTPFSVLPQLNVPEFGGLANDPAQYGVGVKLQEDCSWITFTRCKFRDVHTGVFLESCSGLTTFRGCRFAGEVNSSVFSRESKGANFLECRFDSKPSYAHLEAIGSSGINFLFCHLDREAGLNPETVWDVAFTDGTAVSQGNTIDLCVLCEDGQPSTRPLDVSGIGGLTQKEGYLIPPFIRLEELQPLASGATWISIEAPADWDRASSGVLEVYVEEHSLGAPLVADIIVISKATGFTADGTMHETTQSHRLTNLGSTGEKRVFSVPIDFFSVGGARFERVRVELERPAVMDENSSLTVEAAQYSYGATTLSLSEASIR